MCRRAFPGPACQRHERAAHLTRCSRAAGPGHASRWSPTAACRARTSKCPRRSTSAEGWAGRWKCGRRRDPLCAGGQLSTTPTLPREIARGPRRIGHRRGFTRCSSTPPTKREWRLACCAGGGYDDLVASPPRHERTLRARRSARTARFRSASTTPHRISADERRRDGPPRAGPSRARGAIASPAPCGEPAMTQRLCVGRIAPVRQPARRATVLKTWGVGTPCAGSDQLVH